jgi:Bacterial cadherin-like domain
MRGSVKSISILLGSAALALLPSNAAGQFNNPPTTYPESFSADACQVLTFDVTSNDSDPEGNYPLTLTWVDHSQHGGFYIASPSSVTFRASDREGGGNVYYYVQDSLGATSAGVINYYVFGGSCP